MLRIIQVVFTLIVIIAGIIVLCVFWQQMPSEKHYNEVKQLLKFDYIDQLQAYKTDRRKFRLGIKINLKQSYFHFQKISVIQFVWL